MKKKLLLFLIVSFLTFGFLISTKKCLANLTKNSSYTTNDYSVSISEIEGLLFSSNINFSAKIGTGSINPLLLNEVFRIFEEETTINYTIKGAEIETKTVKASWSDDLSSPSTCNSEEIVYQINGKTHKFKACGKKPAYLINSSNSNILECNLSQSQCKGISIGNAIANYQLKNSPFKLWHHSSDTNLWKEVSSIEIPQSPFINWDVSVKPPPPTVDFYADKENVLYGQDTSIHWNSNGASTCKASGDWTGNQATSGFRNTGTLLADKLYVLECENSGGKTSRIVEITVDSQPFSPDINFSADPPLVDDGDSSSLTWSAENADLCLASGDWSGVKSTTGTEDTGSLSDDTYSYNLNCTNSSNLSSLRIVNVSTFKENIAPPEIISFKSSEATNEVDSVKKVEISWESRNASHCKADGDWSGEKNIFGSELVGPINAARKDYLLTCSNEGGRITALLTIMNTEFNPKPRVSVEILENPIPWGTKPTIKWSSENATECYGFDKNTWSWKNKKIPLLGQDTPYDTATGENMTVYVSCIGPGGTTQASATAPTTESGPLLVELSADQSTISYDGSVNLSWNFENAHYCKKENDQDLSAWNWYSWSAEKHEPKQGITTINNIRANTIFSFRCDGRNESKRIDVAINVDSSTAPPELSQYLPVLQIWADPDFLETPNTSTIHWKAENAIGCQASYPEGTHYDSSKWYYRWKNPWMDGYKDTEGSSSVPSSFPIERTSDYILDCWNFKGSVRGVATVTVASPVHLDFEATPQKIPYKSSAFLKWHSKNAVACKASGGWGGSKNPKGDVQEIKYLTNDREFTLTCEDKDGNETSKTVSVEVVKTNNNYHLSLWSDKYIYALNENGTVYWDSSLDYCVSSGDWDQGVRPGSGNKTFKIDYKEGKRDILMTCSNKEKQHFNDPDYFEIASLITLYVKDSNTINQPQVGLDLWADTYFTTASNPQTKIHWTSNNATYGSTCTASSSANDWVGQTHLNGSFLTEPLTKKEFYTLHCTGPGGSSERTIFISHGVGNQPGPDVNLTVDDPFPPADGDGKVKVSWQVSNLASNCWSESDNSNINNWSSTNFLSEKGYASLEPLEIFPINQKTELTLFCEGSGGLTSKKVIITPSKLLICPNPANINLNSADRRKQLTAWLTESSADCSNILIKAREDITTDYTLTTTNYETSWSVSDESKATISEGLIMAISSPSDNDSVTVTAKNRSLTGQSLVNMVRLINCWKCDKDTNSCSSEAIFGDSCSGNYFDSQSSCVNTCGERNNLGGWKEINP